MKVVIFIPIVYVIEENRKIFDLIKNILKTKNDEYNKNGTRAGKCIFLYDDADFSDDVKKYITDSNILIFKSIKSSKLIKYREELSAQNEQNEQNDLIDLAVLGDCRNNTAISNIQNLYKIKTFLLAIDNTDNLKNITLSKTLDTQIITCGLKEKDTVIFSSIDIDENDDNSVILDLQRSIININGETIEPFDENIKLDKINAANEDLIFALTTLLYCARL